MICAINYHVIYTGIYPPMSDVTDINATCRTRNYRLLATGDDFGQVKIFKFPVLVSDGPKRQPTVHRS